MCGSLVIRFLNSEGSHTYAFLSYDEEQRDEKSSNLGRKISNIKY